MRNKLNITPSNSIASSLEVDREKVQRMVEEASEDSSSITDTFKRLWEDTSLTNQEVAYALFTIGFIAGSIAGADSARVAQIESIASVLQALALKSSLEEVSELG